MLPPPSRANSRNLSSISSLTRKPSTTHNIPITASASPKLRNSSLHDINGPIRSASRSHHPPASWERESLWGKPKDDRRIGETFKDQEKSADNQSVKGERKRPLFGHRPTRKHKKQEVESFRSATEQGASGLPTAANAQSSRSLSTISPHPSSSKSPKTRGKFADYDKAWSTTRKIYEEQPHALISKGNSPTLPLREDQTLDSWFEGQGRMNRDSPLVNLEDCDDVFHSLPFYEPFEDTERTIPEGSSPSSVLAPDDPSEKMNNNTPELIDLDEGLKLVPDPEDYRPGAYNGLSQEEWLLAGQKLIERFTENSQKIQNILTDRAARMSRYTATLGKYYELLKERQTELGEERKSIQDAVRRSILAYWKSQ